MTIVPIFSSPLQLASTASRVSPITCKEQGLPAISYILYQWLMKQHIHNNIIHKTQYTRVHNIGRRTFFIDKQVW